MNLVNSILNGKKNSYRMFREITADILANPEFLKTDNYKHHNGSILEHSVCVAYYSFRIAKKLHLDYISTARGALMHDFFLYDWRAPSSGEIKHHGHEHPKTAFSNASRYFTISRTERDIILHHMWPLTLSPPRTAEAAIVSLMDKHFASFEFGQDMAVSANSIITSFCRAFAGNTSR